MAGVTIGEGAQGKVRKELFRGEWAAVKRVPRGTTTERDIDREYRIFMRAQHPNVVKFLCEPTLEDRFWVIRMEFIQGKDLATLNKRMDLRNKMTIINGMCKGLEHLHSKGIVHQDLKPANIMVEVGSFRAVIVDLGLAKITQSSYGLSSGLYGGTPYYLAPEARGSMRQDKRSDVWAMGKIIAELLLEKTIHPDAISPVYIKQQLSNSPYCDMVSRMLNRDPAARPTCQVIELLLTQIPMMLNRDPAARPLHVNELFLPQIPRMLNRDPAARPLHVPPNNINDDAMVIGIMGIVVIAVIFFLFFFFKYILAYPLAPPLVFTVKL